MSAVIISLRTHRQKKSGQFAETDDGVISLGKIRLLSGRVLKEKYKGQWYEMLQGYANFCFVHDTRPTHKIFYEWLCLQLDIKVKKDIHL